MTIKGYPPVKPNHTTAGFSDEFLTSKTKCPTFIPRNGHEKADRSLPNIPGGETVSTGIKKFRLHTEFLASR